MGVIVSWSRTVKGLIIATYQAVCCQVFFFLEQKTEYKMRISDWSSDVCSSDLAGSSRPARKNTGGRAISAACSAGSDRSCPESARCSAARWKIASTRSTAAWPTACAKQSSATNCHPAYSRKKERKSDVEGQSVSVRVDLGGGRIIQKTKKKKNN